MSDFPCHSSFRRRENPSPGFSKNLHVFVAVLGVVDLEVAVVVAEWCSAVGMETVHCIVWSHMSAQDFAATDFAELYNTDMAVEAALSGEFPPCHPIYIPVRKYILGWCHVDADIELFLRFRTLLVVDIPVFLFHTERYLFNRLFI